MSGTAPTVDSQKGLRLPVLLVLTAVSDIFVRLPADIIAPALSLAGGAIGAPGVAQLTTWGMFAVALLTFGHLAYSFHSAIPAKRPGFRVVFTVWTILLGYQQTIDLGLFVRAVVWLGGAIVGGTTLLWYCGAILGWDVSTADGELVDLLVAIFPTTDARSIRAELAADFHATGPLGRVRSGTAWLAGGMVFAIPIFVCSALLQVLRYAYPLPDLLFLAWGVSAVVVPRISFGPDSGRLVEFGFDLERYLFDAVEHATRSIMGMFCLLFSVVGLILSGLFLYSAVAIAGQVSSIFSLAIGDPSILLDLSILTMVWGWLGTVVLVIAGGGHALWVWLRELARLPRYLDRWEGRTTVDRDVILPAVRGSILVSSQAWAAAILGIALQGTPESTLFALGWPLSFALVAWSVRRTLDREDGTIPRSAPKLVGILAMQTMVFWVGTNPVATGRVVRTGEGLSDLLITPLALVALIAIVALFPYVNRYEADASGRYRYALVGLLLLIGCFGGVWATVETGQARTAGMLLAVTCFISALALTIVRRAGL